MLRELETGIIIDPANETETSSAALNSSKSDNEYLDGEDETEFELEPVSGYEEDEEDEGEETANEKYGKEGDKRNTRIPQARAQWSKIETQKT